MNWNWHSSKKEDILPERAQVAETKLGSLKKVSRTMNSRAEMPEI